MSAGDELSAAIKRRKNPDELRILSQTQTSGAYVRLHAVKETTMSCPLPPEILDLIVDHLHDEPAALKACCVVSKSWVPRARKHLFAQVEFIPPDVIRLWRKAFPDHHSSPAHHTRSLSIGSIPILAGANAGAGSWTSTFRNVVNLCYTILGVQSYRPTLSSFRGFSSTLRSLTLYFITSEIFDLVCSFPLLEDLTLFFLILRNTTEWNVPSTSPRLTGTLGLIMKSGEIRPIARRLLDLPNGLHFTKIAVSCLNQDDVRSATDLLSRCLRTLRSLTFSCPNIAGTFPPIFMIGQSLTASGYRRASHRPLQGH